MASGEGIGQGSGTKSKGRIAIIVAIAIGLAAIVLAIMLGISYKGVNYYEYGFERTISTGNVETNKVYTGGLYLVGPNKEFKMFQADAHFVNLTELNVGTKSGNDIDITVYFQYVLKKDELKALHDAYDLEYDDIIVASATEAIKQTTVTFENIQFLRERLLVEDSLRTAVKNRIHSNCCPKECDEQLDASDDFFCEDGCIPFVQCTAEDMQLHVHLYELQLGNIDLPNDLRSRYLNALLLQAKTEKTELEKNATAIDKETEVQVNAITNEAQEITFNATAEAELITARSTADAKAIVEDAKLNGITMLFHVLNITDPNSMTSINYLRNLQRMANKDFTVGYQYLIQNP